MSVSIRNFLKIKHKFKSELTTMENKNVDSDSSLLKETHSEIQQGLPREIDSLDDFEHLGHDSSPLKETNSDLSASKQPARDGINNGVEISATAANLSEELSSFDPFSSSEKMDSNLLEMGDSFKDRKDDDKLDKFLQDLAPSAPPKHEEPPEIQNKDSDIKSATQQFMDLEREPQQQQKKEEILEKYSDSEDDDFKPSKNEDFQKTTFLPEAPENTDNFKLDTFKDVEDEKQPEPPKKDYPSIPEPAECKKIEIILPLPPQEPITPICKLPVHPEKTTPVKKGGAIDAEAIFCKMGLGEFGILQ